MVRVILSVFVLFLLTSDGYPQSSNPARQSAMQRGTQPPADGVWYVYDRDGNLSKEEHYASYRLNGIIKTFYSSGSINALTSYLDGSREGMEKVFFQKGGLKEENNYQSNNLHGTCREYYENGTIKKESNYTEGKLDGTTKEYFSNGVLKQVWNYKSAIVNGAKLTYSEDGQVTMEENYLNGELVAHKDYTQDSPSLIAARKTAVKPMDNAKIPTKDANISKDTQAPSADASASAKTEDNPKP